MCQRGRCAFTGRSCVLRVYTGVVGRHALLEYTLAIQAYVVSRCALVETCRCLLLSLAGEVGLLIFHTVRSLIVMRRFRHILKLLTVHCLFPDENCGKNFENWSSEKSNVGIGETGMLLSFIVASLKTKEQTIVSGCECSLCHQQESSQVLYCSLLVPVLSRGSSTIWYTKHTSALFLRLEINASKTFNL